MCGNPNPDASFGRTCCPKMELHFQLEAVLKMISEKKNGLKNYRFRVDKEKVDDWLCGPKTNIFS